MLTKKQSLIAAGFSLAGLSLGLAGCSYGGRTSAQGVDKPTDLGNGIYQLPARDWPKNLAAFAKDNPKLQIVDSEVATTTSQGDPTSFVIITVPKK